VQIFSRTSISGLRLAYLARTAPSSIEKVLDFRITDAAKTKRWLHC